MPTTVYFGSNRLLEGPADAVKSYGKGIQPPSSSAEMVFGTAFVDGIDLNTNAQGAVRSLQSVSQGRFDPGVADDLSRAGRNLLVFIHGFDNSFSDALTRGAFNREWVAAAGASMADCAVVAFSWPSLGTLISGPILQADYLHDQNMARLSGVHLMTFFANLEPILRAARKSGSRCFLLAHSMGHLALQSAVENWFLHGNGDGPLFDLAILAAGDCGYDSFSQPQPMQLTGLPKLAKRISTYYSHSDHVLQLSSFVNGGAQRLGQDGPRNRADQTAYPTSCFKSFDATSCQDYSFDLLSSHQYYRQSPKVRAAIVSDMLAC